MARRSARLPRRGLAARIRRRAAVEVPRGSLAAVRTHPRAAAAGGPAHEPSPGSAGAEDRSPQGAGEEDHAGAQGARDEAINGTRQGAAAEALDEDREEAGQENRQEVCEADDEEDHEDDGTEAGEEDCQADDEAGSEAVHDEAAHHHDPLERAGDGPQARLGEQLTYDETTAPAESVDEPVRSSSARLNPVAAPAVALDTLD